MQITKVRHWKQRYDPDAAFIFRKRIVGHDLEVYQPGDYVPLSVQRDRRKLHRLWVSEYIELADYDPERRKIPMLKDRVKHIHGNRYAVMTGKGGWTTVHGKSAAVRIARSLT